MSALDSARGILLELVQQISGEREAPSDEPGYTPLVHVVGDVGRELGERPLDSEDLLRTLPSIAALREAFERDNYADAIPTTPWAALRGAKSIPYAAGALWACSTIIEAAIQRGRLRSRRDEEKVGRAELRARWLELMQKKGQVRLADVKESLRADGLEADDSQISKAVGDLMSDDLARDAVDPPRGDRRARYYESTEEIVPASVRRTLWEAARHAKAHVSEEDAAALFREALKGDVKPDSMAAGSAT